MLHHRSHRRLPPGEIADKCLPIYNKKKKKKVRSGRPVTDKISAIFKKVEQDRYITSYNIAEELDVDHKTIMRHLRKSMKEQEKT